MKKLLFLVLPFRTRFLAGPCLFFFVTIGFAGQKVAGFWISERIKGTRHRDKKLVRGTRFTENIKTNTLYTSNFTLRNSNRIPRIPRTENRKPHHPALYLSLLIA